MTASLFVESNRKLPIRVSTCARTDTHAKLDFRIEMNYRRVVLADFLVRTTEVLSEKPLRWGRFALFCS